VCVTVCARVCACVQPRHGAFFDDRKRTLRRRESSISRKERKNERKKEIKKEREKEIRNSRRVLFSLTFFSLYLSHPRRIRNDTFRKGEKNRNIRQSGTCPCTLIYTTKRNQFLFYPLLSIIIVPHSSWSFSLIFALSPSLSLSLSLRLSFSFLSGKTQVHLHIFYVCVCIYIYIYI
jgi:hypothetical protein